ncbi:hypothetical protein J6590_084091 [Homalodisca vitripennis]|nr:hypothetical protein J6590_084091 [Homalodisca vitripennis]
MSDHIIYLGRKRDNAPQTPAPLLHQHAAQQYQLILAWLNLVNQGPGVLPWPCCGGTTA